MNRKKAWIILPAVVLVLAVYLFAHWTSTVDEADREGLSRQAAAYLGAGDKLMIEQIEKRGDYLAALCRNPHGAWSMCVFAPDPVFRSRWKAQGGKPSLRAGEISSWNYGSPKGEAVIIVCGGEIPENVRWYRFDNNKTTYTRPVDGEKVLDILVTPDSTDIVGHPIPLDSKKQEIA